MSYIFPPTGGGGGLTIGDVKADVDIADALTKKHSQNTDAYLNTTPASTFYVDIKRTDSYIEMGTITRPFKTIMAAINQVIANGDNTQTNPYAIRISQGVYPEMIVLEDPKLVSLLLLGTGSRLQTQINPTSGLSLRSEANNATLYDLHVENIQFIKPTSMIGANNNTYFGYNFFFLNCYWPNGALATFKNMTYPSFEGLVCKFSGGLVLSNVTQCSINNTGGIKTGAFTVETNESANKPYLFSGGTKLIVTGGACPNTTWSLLNIVSLTGTALQLRSCRYGASGETIPVNAQVLAYNSVLVGDYVNNGALTLYNSQVTGTMSGTAPVLYNFAAQVKNIPTGTISAVNVQDAVNELAVETNLVSSVVLGDTFAVNQAFQINAGACQPVTSLDALAPCVDGIVLTAGILGATVTAACVQGGVYVTTVALPAEEQLWLGQDGKITGTVPSLLAGDVWMVPLGRRDDATHFIFDPQEVVKL